MKTIFIIIIITIIIIVIIIFNPYTTTRILWHSARYSVVYLTELRQRGYDEIYHS